MMASSGNISICVGGDLSAAPLGIFEDWAAFQVESLSGLLHSRVHIELQSLVINTDSWQIFEVIWQLQLEEILIGRLAQ